MDRTAIMKRCAQVPVFRSLAILRDAVRGLRHAAVLAAMAGASAPLLASEPGDAIAPAVLRAVPPSTNPATTVVRNVGQFPADARFGDPAPGRRFHITDRGMRVRTPSGRHVEQVWSGAHTGARAESPTGGTWSLRVGDRSRWAENEPLYQQVRLPAIAPGIDVLYYGNGSHLEHDLIVAPGADPAPVHCTFPESERIAVDDRGGLMVTSSGETVALLPPIAWQRNADGRRVTVPARYTVEDGRVGFALGDYDRSRELIIDPVLVMASFLGGSGAESTPLMRFDSAGKLFVLTKTASFDLPLVAPLDGTKSVTSTELYLAKIDPDAGTLLWATYIGGSGDESLDGLRVLPGGDVVVGSSVTSTDMPTANAYQATHGGGFASQPRDLWLGRISGDGSALQWGTYFGGGDSETLPSMSMNPSTGQIVMLVRRYIDNLTGQTLQSSFPKTNATSLGGINTVGTGYGVPRTNENQAIVIFSADGALQTSRTVGCDQFLEVDANGQIFLAGGAGPFFPGFGAITSTVPMYEGVDQRPSLSVLNPDLSVKFSARLYFQTSLGDMAISGDGTHIILSNGRTGTDPNWFSVVNGRPNYANSNEGDMLYKLTFNSVSGFWDRTWTTYYTPGGRFGASIFDMEVVGDRLVLSGTGTKNIPLKDSLNTSSDGTGFITIFNLAPGTAPAASNLLFSTFLSGVTRSVAVDPRPGVLRYAGASNFPEATGLQALVNPIQDSDGTNNGYGAEDLYISVIDTSTALPTVSLSALDASAGEAPGNPGTIRLTRVGPTTQPLVVTLNITGSADNGIDYQNIVTACTIPAGSSSVDIQVQPLADGIAESNETVQMAIYGGGITYQTGNTNSTATVTIANEGNLPVNPPVIRLTKQNSDYSMKEGPYDQAKHNACTIEWLNYPGGAASLTVDVQYSGTAERGTFGVKDYFSETQPMVLKDPWNLGTAGVYTATINLRANNDNLVEGPESIIVTLPTSASYQIQGSPSMTFTLADDDGLPPPPVLPVVSLSAGVINGAEGGANPTFVISATGKAATSSLQVLLDVPTGSAVTGIDYQALPASVVIGPNQTAVTLTVNVIDDSVVETSDYLGLSVVANPAAYTLGAQTIATVIIADNDVGAVVPTVNVEAIDDTADEHGGSGAVRISRSGTTASALTVHLSVGGTASPDDYVALSGPFTIPAGQATVTLAIQPIDDAVVEPPETVVLSLQADPDYQAGIFTTATVTVTDNDSGGSLLKPTISLVVDDAQASEAGQDPGRVTIARSGGGATAAVVVLQWSGSANGADATGGLPASVTLTVNQPQITLILTPVDDSAVEGPEAFDVAIVPSADYNLANEFSGTIALSDNDALNLPVVDVRRGGVAVMPGSTDQVGSTVAGSSTSLTYVITNTGFGSMSLTAPVISSAVNVSVVPTLGSTTVAAGATTQVLLAATPTAAGSWSAIISMATNVPGANPFTGTISGTATGSNGNTAPTITAPIQGATLAVTEDVATTLTVSATDPDAGQTLTWTATVPTKGVIGNLGTGTSRILTFTPTANANGSDSFQVTVSDGAGGSTTRTVTVTIAAVNDPPVNTTLPAISGSATVGQVLSASTGQWNDIADGNPAVTAFAYQWRRATAPVGGTVTTIVGATAATYTLTSGDVGGFMEVVVTATDSGAPGTASASAVSARTGAVQTGSVGVPGDIDGDALVDFGDLLLFVDAYGSAPGDANYNANADMDPADPVIDFGDLLLFIDYYSAANS
jgi:hypothetical protein